MPNPDDPKPWEHQSGESTKSFAMFCLYRDMRPAERSLAKVALQAKRSSRQMEHLASNHSWVERVRAWDGYQDRIGRRERMAAESKMVQRHAIIASKMQELVAKKLQTLTSADLTVADCARLFQTSARLERDARKSTASDMLAEADIGEHAMSDEVGPVEAALGRTLRGTNIAVGDQPAVYPADIDDDLDEDPDEDDAAGAGASDP